MTRFRRGHSALLAIAVLAALGLAGCTSTLSASDIASQAKTDLNRHLAAQGATKRVASVSCPRDLDARVGASEVCSGVGTPGNAHLNITATVTSVSGSTAHVSFNAVEGPAPSNTGTTT